MDSFLGGLVNTLKEDDSDTFSLKQEIDSSDLVSFIKSIAENLKFTASSLASLHVNFALCRRDCLLAQSQALAKSQSTKASLRALPLHSEALFGGDHLSPTIHGLAEARRDLAFVVPRQAARPTPKGRAGESQRGRGAKSLSSRVDRHKSSFSKDKGRSGKPYERLQAPKANTKPSPQ